MDFIPQISEYLRVNNLSIRKIGKTDEEILKLSINGKEYKGLASIIFRIMDDSQYHMVINITEQSLIYQWFEYASRNGPQLNISSPEGKIRLTELNDYLENYSYLIGYNSTIADVVIYYFLYKTFLTMNPLEKAAYLHLSRWFNHIQSDEQIRQCNKIINFFPSHVLSRIPLQN